MANEEKEEKMESGDNLNLGQIIVQTGDFGRFQILIMLFFVLSLLTLNWSMLTMSFSGTIPEWDCDGSASGWNGSLLNSSYDSSKNCETINKTSCPAYKFTPDMKTVVSEWDLVCGRKWIAQSITTIQMSGLLVGGLTMGHVNDAIGRKPTTFLSIATLGIANLISYFSVSWEMFAVMRFIIGFACAGYMSGNVLFELMRNKWRLVIAMIPNWPAWSGLLALFCWLVHDWKYIHIAIAAVSLVSMSAWWVMPESFRWLIAHGRLEDAENVIRRMAKTNGKPMPDLSHIRKVMEDEVAESEKVKTLPVYTVVDLFRSRYLAKLTLLFGFIWLASAYAYYGIAFGVQELSGSLYLNMFLLGVIDIPGNILNWIVNRWAGRRWTCVIFYTLSGLASAAVGTLQNIGFENSGLINVFALISKLFVSAAWEVNTIWVSECYPTVVRNIGAGFISSLSRVGSMVAPQVITLSGDIPGLLYIVSGVVMVVSAFLCVFLPETKDKDLTDVLHDKSTEQGHVKIEKELVINGIKTKD